MKLYIVYYYYHYDDYKRADSFADVINVFLNSENAYQCAVENFMKKIRDKLSLNWIVKPCRYDDNIKKDAILIVGI